MTKTIRAIQKYGLAACVKAHRLNTEQGEGASSIAFGYDLGRPLTTRQVDAAIDAGGEIARVQSKARGTTILTDAEEDLLHAIHAAK